MPNHMDTPSALPMIRSQYTDLAQKSKRIPKWLPIACFASALIGIPIVLSIGGGLLLSYLRKRDMKKLDEFYQENIVPLCLTQVFGVYEYSRAGAVPEAVVYGSGIVPAGTGSFHGDTFISADYRGMPLEMSNLVIKGKGDDKDAKVFEGPFAVYRCGKYVPGNVWIFEKENKSLATVAAGQILTGQKEFDRQFNVFSDNPAVVPTVLDFRAMNAILDAESKLPGHIRFSLIGGSLYMAVEGGSPLLSKAVPKGQHQPGDIDELTSRAMFEVSTLVDIADALCFDD